MAAIEVSEKERAVGKFVLKYDCVNDQYSRPFGGDGNEQQKGGGWDSLAKKEGGVYRKIEPDWRAFLTSEGNGQIRWVIRHPNLWVKRAEARMSGWATFRGGQLGGRLICGNKEETIPLANQPFLAEQTAERVWGLNREGLVERIRIEEIGLADQTTLAIEFADLESNQGLDHDLDDAQVFRTPLGQPNAENLVIEIEFEPPAIQQQILMETPNSAMKVPADEVEDVVSKKILHLQMNQQEKSEMGGAVRVSKSELDGIHCFLLKYDCVRDQYRRPFNLDGQALVDGWKSLAHSIRGVDRLTEKETEEFAYIGSNAARGEMIWRIEHPGARVGRVELLLSGMSTPDEMGDENAKIGVDLVCGEHGSQRRPDAIPFNAQRIDVMEMERVGPADFTEIRVNFQRNEPGGKPSQLFRAVFGEAATADDFVLLIEFEQPKENGGGIVGEGEANELAAKLHKMMGQLKGEKTGTLGHRTLLLQIILLLGGIGVKMRQKVVQRIGKIFGMDFERELRESVPRESADLVEYLLRPNPQMEPIGQENVPKLEAMPQPKEPTPAMLATYPSLAQSQSPPIRPSPPKGEFDLEKAAELIHRSIARNGGGGGGLMKMFKKKEKSDVEAILQTLLAVNWQMRQSIGQIYKRRFEHEDLVEAIRKEVQEGGEKELILGILDGPANLDAIHLHKAIAGLGTTESVLIEILTSRTNGQILEIKKIYGQMFGKQLEADIGGDTSGAFRTLLLSLCAANRDESLVVRQEKAEQDAQSLYAGGEKKWGTDEDTFIALLARENLLQLRALSEEYNRLTGHHLDEAIRGEFSGDCRDGLLAIVGCARNSRRLFADWIHAAIKDNKEGDAIRLLCTHPNANFNLNAIAAEYQGIYGVSLAQAFYDSKLHAKHGLANIVNRGGVI